MYKFSSKQRLVLHWWHRKKHWHKDAVICDGAIRSGKTLSMSLGFVMWASAKFNGMAFAMCGKTITSLRRNVVTPLLEMLRGSGFVCTEKLSMNYIDISLNDKTNRFYLFGGRDESSAALIQGITLAGVFLDEVVLMPRSFVEQALARCSVNGSKMWFNCNPGSPAHWFYCEWIKKAREKNALYIHFTMDDNPALPERVKNATKGSISARSISVSCSGSGSPRKGSSIPCSTRKNTYIPALDRIANATSFPAITAPSTLRHSVCGGFTKAFGTA